MNLGQRTLNALTMALVAGLSFALLVFVGLGEAKKSYEQFYVEKLTAQNRVMVNAIESFLNRNLPIEQYVGFKPRAGRLIASDPTIAAIDLFDQDGERIFTAGDPTIGLLAHSESLLPAKGLESGAIEVRRDQTYLQVLLPLRNATSDSGKIAISMPHVSISEEVNASFALLVPVVVIVTAIFAAIVFFSPPIVLFRALPLNQVIYAGMFMLISIFVVTTLADLYFKGVQVKTKTLADSLAERMIEVVGFNLDIEKIPGLDRAFAEYRRLNPDISAAALVVDGDILIHTDSLAVGNRWSRDPGVYEYFVDITPVTAERTIEIVVTLPHKIVYWRTARSVKNFAALFIASAFLASVFMQLVSAMEPRSTDPPRTEQARREAEEQKSLQIVKPIFYMALCIEHLSYAFMPQYIANVVVAAGWPESFTSTIFTIYYLCFALSLIPAGYFGQRFSPKPLMIGGLALSMLSATIMLVEPAVWTIIAARALAGVGQAILLIGIQSYILAVTSPERKTQGAAIIVYGFQGGMISGMAIGSLLVGNIGVSGVFSISVVTLALTAIFAWRMIPNVHGERRRQEDSLTHSVVTLVKDVGVAFRSVDVMQTIILVGVPAKAILTGIVVFAVPLLMADAGYRQEDIGQLIMVYAAGVVLANAYIPRLVDRSGNTASTLTLGALLSGLGLACMSFVGYNAQVGGILGSALEPIVLLIGVICVGLAHGMINAPIVSHIANLPLAASVGVGTLTATYRFLERIGHVAGPLIIGLMFTFLGQTGMVLGWVGMAVALAGTLFWSIATYRASLGSRQGGNSQAPRAVTEAELQPRLAGVFMAPGHHLLVMELSSPDAEIVIDGRSVDEHRIRYRRSNDRRIGRIGEALETFSDTLADNFAVNVELVVICDEDMALGLSRIPGFGGFRCAQLPKDEGFVPQLGRCLAGGERSRAGLSSALGRCSLGRAFVAHGQSELSAREPFWWVAALSEISGEPRRRRAAIGAA